jgi:hypothetical protein
LAFKKKGGKRVEKLSATECWGLVFPLSLLIFKFGDWHDSLIFDSLNAFASFFFVEEVT